MSLVSQIMDAVQQAKDSLGDLVVSVHIKHVENGAYDPITLTAAKVETTFDVDGFVGQWDELDRRDEEIRFDDVKFFVFPTSKTIGQGDTLDLGGFDYGIVRVSPVKAGNRTALTQLQLRK